MFAAVESAALVGVEPSPVRVEVHVGASVTQKFRVVGLPDTAVREATERVKAAFSASGLSFPRRQVIVNLAPADLPKVGSAYDLPIALGVLAADDARYAALTRVVALGELALDGEVRAARGGLAAARVAERLRRPCLLAPSAAAEAALVDGCDLRPVRSLAEAVAAAQGTLDPIARPVPAPAFPSDDGLDLAEVRGQLVAKRALEVAAAGGHHLLFRGPPGVGKTMLARCLPGILPPLTRNESLEVAQAWAAAGRPRSHSASPPFRDPHHTTTAAAMVGGGSGVPTPGEVTLAHRGVLFLDELGEFPPHLLNVLRQPLEEGVVRVARRGVGVVFPCVVQAVAATNPCPCGFADDGRRDCRCTPAAVQRYQGRLSGPLLDRFDVRVDLVRPADHELTGRPGEASAVVRERVVAARELQVARGGLNRSLSGRELDSRPVEAEAQALLRQAISQSGLSGRGWNRVRRVASTIADLDGSAVLGAAHVAEALVLRKQI